MDLQFKTDGEEGTSKDGGFRNEILDELKKYFTEIIPEAGFSPDAPFRQNINIDVRVQNLAKQTKYAKDRDRGRNLFHVDPVSARMLAAVRGKGTVFLRPGMTYLKQLYQTERLQARRPEISQTIFLKESEVRDRLKNFKDIFSYESLACSTYVDASGSQVYTLHETPQVLDNLERPLSATEKILGEFDRVLIVMTFESLVSASNNLPEKEEDDGKVTLRASHYVSEKLKYYSEDCERMEKGEFGRLAEWAGKKDLTTREAVETMLRHFYGFGKEKGVVMYNMDKVRRRVPDPLKITTNEFYASKYLKNLRSEALHEMYAAKYLGK